MPIVNMAGIDPVCFGVLFMIHNAIGPITPPVGVVPNTAAGVGRDDVTAGVVPFMIAGSIAMFLMVLFPKLVTVPASCSPDVARTALLPVIEDAADGCRFGVAARRVPSRDPTETDVLRGTHHDTCRSGIAALSFRTRPAGSDARRAKVR